MAFGVHEVLSGKFLDATSRRKRRHGHEIAACPYDREQAPALAGGGSVLHQTPCNLCTR